MTHQYLLHIWQRHDGLRIIWYLGWLKAIPIELSSNAKSFWIVCRTTWSRYRKYSSTQPFESQHTLLCSTRSLYWVSYFFSIDQNWRWLNTQIKCMVRTTTSIIFFKCPSSIFPERGLLMNDAIKANHILWQFWVPLHQSHVPHSLPQHCRTAIGAKADQFRPNSSPSLPLWVSDT